MYLTSKNNSVFEAFPIFLAVITDFAIAWGSLIFIGVRIVGAVISHYHDTSVRYPALIKQWSLPLENRLLGAMIGSPILVIGIFWLGWIGIIEEAKKRNSGI